MAPPTGSEFDLVMRDALHDLNGNTSPSHRAATDGMSRRDLECMAICFADPTIGRLAAAARPIVASEAAVDPQQRCPFPRPPLTEDGGLGLVESAEPHSIGITRVSLHALRPFCREPLPLHGN
jgi:hypothetical protein